MTFHLLSSKTALQDDLQSRDFKILQETYPKSRCPWANPKNPLYIKYHDEEWGIPVHDDQKLFEMLILESFQAGLSWECVLNKRQAFRTAFDNFNIDAIVNYTEDKIQQLKANANIIRNERKIRATITNALIYKEIQTQYGSFSTYLWNWTGGTIIHEVGPTHSALSDRISHDLQNRGMKFVGTTIIYSYLQAVGVINAHLPTCYLFSLPL